MDDKILFEDYEMPGPDPIPPVAEEEPPPDRGNGHHTEEVIAGIGDYVARRLQEPGLMRWLAHLPQTDAGNAEAFVRMYGAKFRYDHLRGKHGQWLRWNGNRWECDSLGQVQRVGISVARARLASAATIDDKEIREKALGWARQSEQRGRLNSMLDLASWMPPITALSSMFDLDPWLLSVGNGELDLRTGNLYPASSCSMITKGTPVSYNPDAGCPKWDKFLSEIFAGSRGMIDFVQRSVGYSLCANCREQVLFLCWGAGANGKGTLFNTLRAMLGTYAADTPMGTFEASYGDTASNDLAALAGARLVTASETREGKPLNESRVKRLTGCDPVTCRFLFNEFFTYTPGYKIWLAMNHKPEIRGTDRGIWRRVRLLPFNVSFEANPDKELESKLKEELPGILAWAVRGCLAWQKDGLKTAAEVLKETEEYRKDSDLVGQFLDENMEEAPLGGVMATQLLGAYNAWALGHGEEAITGTALGRRLSERGVKHNRLGTGIQYPYKFKKKPESKDPQDAQPEYEPSEIPM
ncbi:MAG TPA: phage/plasmid primase, P4 family [Verrucomicrobiota bacterium]|nr:phage/plasmid primase, P4 family [Verrucomicrobiota bacterium]